MSVVGALKRLMGGGDLSRSFYETYSALSPRRERRIISDFRQPASVLRWSTDGEYPLVRPAAVRVVEDLANIGTTEASLGRFPQTEVEYREAEEILKAWYGPNNQETIQLSSMLGLILIQENKLAEAESLLQHVLESQEQSLGKEHPTVGFTLDTLGKLAIKRGNLERAEMYFGRALKVYETALGDTNPQTAMIKSHLADVFVKERQYARAEPFYRSAVACLTARPLKGNVSVGVVEVSLGRVLLHQKRYREAEHYLAAGYAIVMTQPGAYPARIQEAREDLATVYMALDEPEQAASFRAKPAFSKVAR